MPITGSEAYQLYQDRAQASSPTIERMKEVRDIYDGEIVIPLPEMDRQEKPAVANLVAEGIDQQSMRVASTMPNLLMPGLDERQERGRGSKEWGDIRRRAVLGWWDASNMRLVNYRKARYMVSYGVTAIQISVDTKRRIPIWRPRNPLHTYPDPGDWYEDYTPKDCIFAYKRSYAWIMANYPEAAERIWRRRNMRHPSREKLYELVEYVDGDELVLFLCYPENDGEYEGNPATGLSGTPGDFDELVRVPNKAGVCTVVAPKRIQLEKNFGQFYQTHGIYENQAKLQALDYIATRKSVFPDLVAIGENGRVVQIAGDEWKDGATGEINYVQNGQVQYLQLQPGFRTSEALARLENNIRQAGVPNAFSGEQGTNVRSARQTEVALSSMVDFRIQEYQTVMSASTKQEVEIAIAVAKGFFGSEKKSFHVNWKGATGRVDYTPNTHFEDGAPVEVVYPMPGADVNGITVAAGNLMGMGVISAQYTRELHPLVRDAELERDRVTRERLEQSLMESISMMVQQGALPPNDLAGIMNKVLKQNMDLADAVEAQQQEAQERQAEQVEATDPAAQAGIAVPGTGAESATIPEPEPGLSHMRQLLGALSPPQGMQPDPMAAGVGA